ncbi:carbohydrate esterase family 15 protein [Hypoxylon trugodes]|uniref:carbohydrate esterase family 15 protein n=1 Tax=Hypoxylon trugodes TaxID=326681 RepID=UPI00219824A1|nr:carbohydrate esterase family 15 protein [Hypoxylon trugodes]KAI1384515.1 carbohydrate esterase family 15 protein [Hypoxylon trugodes]
MKFFITALGLVSLATAQEYSPTPTTCVVNNATYPKSAKLPDPFLLADGKRLGTKDEWACKRAEIRDQIQRFELGPKPPKPTVSATASSGKINIVSSEGGKSASFSVSLKLPSGTGPFPAVIAFESSSIPVPAGVATITFPNHDVAADDPHGKGKFFDLYGSSHTAGSLIAWAWGVSRVIDALEQLGPDTTKIDTKRLAVTGCSRNGKGALIAGAFDDRIALTIPQEGGSGGPGCWRIVADFKKNGTRTEDATQIITGDSWFSTAFAEYAPDTTVLPYDHHMLMALVAPRALLVIENSGIDYLGPISTYGCSIAARMVYTSLGAEDAIGLSQAAHGTSHCSMPSSQNPEVAAFYNKYLLGQTDVETDVVKTDGKFTWYAPQWIDWTTATLA